MKSYVYCRFRSGQPPDDPVSPSVADDSVDRDQVQRDDARDLGQSAQVSTHYQ